MSRLERGVHGISLMTLLAFATAFDVSVASLLEDTDEKRALTGRRVQLNPAAKKRPRRRRV
jgi:transcriptional regulator with XRE-family HTH domain